MRWERFPLPCLAATVSVHSQAHGSTQRWWEHTETAMVVEQHSRSSGLLVLLLPLHIPGPMDLTVAWRWQQISEGGRGKPGLSSGPAFSLPHVAAQQWDRYLTGPDPSPRTTAPNLRPGLRLSTAKCPEPISGSGHTVLGLSPTDNIPFPLAGVMCHLTLCFNNLIVILVNINECPPIR